MSAQPTNVQLSLSIEETNKIRISMGLKPLKEEPKDSKPKQQQDKPINDETLNVLDTINKLKKKRELNSKLIGKSIAEQLLDQDENEEDFDVSNWVNKSRQTEKQKQIEKKKSLTGKQPPKQQHYNQSNLQGMRVGNDIKNFEDESEHILTLQDSSVLDNDSEDVLVNVNISEREKRQNILQSNKKKSKYELEEEEENNETTINVDRNGFVIGGDGKIDQSTDSSNGNANGLSLREQAKKNLEHLQSYDMEQNTTSSILSSFYTQEEMDKFKKSRESSNGGNSNGKKKKKLRKKSTTENILNELDATTSSDLGSRSSRSISEKDKKEQATILTREENYKKALDKASEISKLTYSSDLYEEAEDEEFYKSLSTAKKAPVLQEKSIAEKMKKKQKDASTNVNMGDDDDGTNLEEITINPTSEFVRSLNPDGLISNYRSSNTSVNSNNGSNGSNMDEDKEDEEMINIEKQESKDGEEDDDSSSSGEDEDGNYNQGKSKKFKNHETNATSILLEEPLASSGVSAALRLLAQKGDLQPNPISSSKKKNINYDDNSESTVIEHKDEFGRIMNRQQAFVKMSQIFHGNKSGKNKMEKRKRLYEEELKKKKMDSNDTPLGMVKSFQSFQEKTNSPYLVISGGSATNVLKQNSIIQQANINNKK